MDIKRVITRTTITKGDADNGRFSCVFELEGHNYTRNEDGVIYYRGEKVFFVGVCCNKEDFVERVARDMRYRGLLRPKHKQKTKKVRA